MRGDRPPGVGRLTLEGLLTAHGGRMRVRDFINAALYDPDSGYYTANIRTVGRHGDFSTSASLPHLQEPLAAAIAARARQSGHRHLIEVGAGNGSLAVSVLRALGWWGRRKIRYHIVDASPKLAALQRETLAGARLPAEWHPSMEGAVSATGGRAFVFSNELVDAFPPHLFQWDSHRGTWLEVSLSLGADGRVFEVCNPPSHPLDALLPGDLFPDGQRIEIHSSYQEWLARWVPALVNASLLTIDYGARFPDLYRRRPGGTLRAYFHHQRLTGTEIYSRPGLQDITADVNFSQIDAWGCDLGMETVRLTTQAEFVGETGSPDGTLGAFLVLEQRVSQ